MFVVCHPRSCLHLCVRVCVSVAMSVYVCDNVYVYCARTLFTISSSPSPVLPRFSATTHFPPSVFEPVRVVCICM